MKVCLVIKRFQHREVIGGAEAFAGRLAYALQAKGLSVSVFSARYKPSWKGFEYVPHFSAKELEYIQVFRFAFPRFRFIGSLFYLFSLFRNLIRKRNSYDVVCVNYASQDLIAAILAKKFTHKPIVCKIACSGENGDLGQLKKRWYARTAFRLFKEVDCFIALNSMIIDELKELGISSSSIVCIPNGLDTHNYSPANEETRRKVKRELGVSANLPLLISVGRLSKQKGFDTLIKALALVKAKGTSVAGIILGKGLEQIRLADMIREYELQNHVVITFDTNITRYLQAADIFVLPSRWEGLPNALLEAMASGIPCIASDIPGNNEVIEHCRNGILFPLDDHVSLACALEMLIANAEARHKLGIEARSTVLRKYTIAQTAESYIDLFCRLTGFPVETARECQSQMQAADVNELGEIVCRQL